MHVDVHPDVPTSTSTFVHAARGGAKVRLAKPLAIAGGFGGGFSAAGLFVSPEAGPIVAWENRYVVPFLATRFGVSSAHLARAVDTSQAAGRLADSIAHARRGSPRASPGSASPSAGRSPRRGRCAARSSRASARPTWPTAATRTPSANSPSAARWCSRAAFMILERRLASERERGNPQRPRSFAAGGAASP